MSYGVDWTCECGWANLDVRKKCRNCGKEPDWKSRADSLAAELAKAREALTDVCNPLGKMRRDAEAQGAVLSGMAYQIANSLAYVQDIAREALLSLPITGHSESGD